MRAINNAQLNGYNHLAAALITLLKRHNESTAQVQDD